MKKPQPRTSNTPQPVPSPELSVFDNALPETLQTWNDPAAVQHVPILRGVRAETSPYIIKLSRPHAAEQILPPAHASSLPQLIVDDEDEALPVSLHREHEIGVARHEVASQLREFDIQLDLPEFDDEQLAEADVPEVFMLPAEFTAAAASVAQVHDLVRQAHEEAPVAASAPIIIDEPIFSETPPRDTVSWRRFFVLPHHWQRALAAFTGLSFLLVMPLHAMQAVNHARDTAATMSDTGKSAIEDFSRGASAFAEARYTLAEDEFSRAAAKFADAESELGSMHAAIAAVVSVIPQTDRTHDSVKGLITAGRELSTVAAIMSEAADTIAPATAIDFVTKLTLLATAAKSAAPHAEIAAESVAAVRADVVPAEYIDQVAQLQEYAPKLATALREFLTFSNTLATIMGGDGAMRYILAFQNSTELRPTGGFIGSFAEATIHNGAIEKMHIPGGGTYDVQGQLTEFVFAPSPLTLLRARWEMQDANWFPDFASSARKMQWFYEHAGGPTTDGVIAINSAFVVNLLEIVGPIAMPEYDRVIDAENFMFETQKIVELEYDLVENAPKAFIGDLAPLLLEKVTEADMQTFMAVLDLVGRSLAEKDIQLYFDKNSLEAAVEELGWSGTIHQTSGDYLMVVNTNLGGGKTDQVIDQDVQVDVAIDEDGSVINTVTVKKTHHGMPNALFSGKNNVDYIRLYVPQGSTLLSASGFEIPPNDLFEISDLPLEVDKDLAKAMTDITHDPDSQTAIWNEFGKTVFGNWMQTAAGETEVVTFTYKLPFTLAADTQGLIAKAKAGLGWGSVVPYSLFVQKQSGADLRTTSIAITLPSAWTSAWESHAGVSTNSVTIDNSVDAAIHLLIERP